MEDNRNPNCNSASNKNGKPAEDQAEKQTSTLCHCGLLLVCFGFFCVLMTARLGVTIHMSITMKKQQESIGNITTEIERLVEEQKMMESQNKELSRQRDDLNRTLGFILKFDNFPVNDFCPDKKCPPCPKNWISFQRKCYLFYNEPAPWKTWNQSREFCQEKHADLVVIDDLQEQEFISNHSKYYQDEYHGYWLGLQETNNTWIWVDGHEDTLGFWIKGQFETVRSNALLIPGRNLPETWSKEENRFKNKFICEQEALI